MIKHFIQSSLSNKIRISITKGILSYQHKCKSKFKNEPQPSFPHQDILVEEILGALGDSIEDMLDILKQGFIK